MPKAPEARRSHQDARREERATIVALDGEKIRAMRGERDRGEIASISLQTPARVERGGTPRLETARTIARAERGLPEGVEGAAALGK